MTAEPPPPSLEVPPWLKSLPAAPEYRPSLADFSDPIAYILKIEPEASRFGICKIVPPLPPPPKKSAAANLARSFAARRPDGSPAFTTRQQQVGLCPRRPRPAQRPVWQSGQWFTLPEFEARARRFERAQLRKCGRRAMSELETESLFWSACAGRPFSVEYANDVPGSGFPPVGGARKRRGKAASNVGETAWNMRGVSRANGSLLRFMKEEIPGVTSPMVYVAMMFSWFAWHVEDHELHSLNYLHMGSGKTWYGVPRDARLAFEDVVRVHGYGEEVNPLVTFAILGEKTTVMSPEVLIGAGIPCCRLVQNAGEFVVTFPGSYHSGFSHGFNCGEAANIATPEWLKVAKEAAIRRASTNCPPMVSHFQLLYALALSSLCSRMPITSSTEPRSSRLKDKMRGEGEVLVKDIFVQNVMENNSLLGILLDKGSSCIVVPQKTADNSLCYESLFRSHVKVKPRLSLGLYSHQETLEASGDLLSHDIVTDRNLGIEHLNDFYSVKGNSIAVCDGKGPSLAKCSKFTATDIHSSTSGLQSVEDDKENTLQDNGLSDQGLLSCVTCGILSFACMAVLQPSEAAARFLMSADCSSFNDQIFVSGEIRDIDDGSNHGTRNYELISGLGQLKGHVQDRLNDDFIDCSMRSIQASDHSTKLLSDALSQREISALDLLASAYDNSSDSEEEELLHKMPVCTNQNDSRDSMLTCNPIRQLTSANPSQNLCSNENLSVETDTHMLGEDCCNGAPEISINPLKLVSGSELSAQDSRLIDGSHIHRIQCVKAEAKHEMRKELLPGTLPEFCAPQNHEELEASSNSGPTSGFDSVAPSSAALTEQVSYVDASVKSSDMSIMQRCGKDSSRMHIFCLEHAVEVEKQLRPKGGVHIMLLCHPDYPKLEEEAKLLAEELGMDHQWADNPFREATKDDQERIRMALEDEEAIPTSSDWAVKMGINLYYSANLSKAPLYSKQMPYNAVIYKAFCCNPPSLSPVEPEVSGRKLGRQKKIVVAGKWCGKVWRSNQVHPFLAHIGDAEEEEVVEEFHDQGSKQKPKCERTSTIDITTTKSGRKRKKPSRKSSAKKNRSDQSNNSSDIEDAGADSSEQCEKVLRSRTSSRKKIINGHKLNLKHEAEGGPSNDLRRQPKSEQVKSKQTADKHNSNKKAKTSRASNRLTKEQEVEYPCDVEGCPMSFSTKHDLALHKRNICPVEGCRKKFFSHKYMVQHQKVHMDDRPLKCPWKGCKMSFKWPWARTEHIRVHTGDRPYICREAGCGQTFRFVSDFSRHKRKTGHVSAKRKRG